MHDLKFYGEVQRNTGYGVNPVFVFTVDKVRVIEISCEVSLPQMNSHLNKTIDVPIFCHTNSNIDIIERLKNV